MRRTLMNIATPGITVSVEAQTSIDAIMASMADVDDAELAHIEQSAEEHAYDRSVEM
jgi:hypothetical protein